ncbi:MAG: hypothetical protein KF809_14790 [Chloroflexi bacterium]|nr:hypothetical protein [Chloroflexota bacterium]
MEDAPMDHLESLESIIESAARMGVELDRDEAERWIAAMAAEADGPLEVDVQSGVYGHRVTMADHSPADLARIRRVAEVVGIPNEPPDVLTALALSGSAAQAKIQRYPADCDFFERVHIRADTREAALDRLGGVLRTKALATYSGPGYRLWEVKWGTHDRAGTVRGDSVEPGAWISWAPEEVRAGVQELVRDDGSIEHIHWSEAPGRPGWAKMDWLVGDRERGILSNASSVIDPTWEAPDGTIVPLDGFLDPYFQEVYLDADTIPLFTRLVGELGADAVDDYVEQLEREVHTYTVRKPNHGKAARRMYNIFRLSGRYAEAAYLRELFDEPVTALYQLAALLETIADAASVGPEVFDRDLLVGQVDQLIMSAVAALDGPDEALMVDRLRRFRALVAGDEVVDGSPEGDVGLVPAASVEVPMALDWSVMHDARSDALRDVDDYFRRVLRAVPSIADYLDEIAARPA